MHSRIVLSAVSGSLVARPLAVLALAWHSIAAYRLDTYRPEKHYMRGPGPKWHEKHGPIETAQHHSSATRLG